MEVICITNEILVLKSREDLRQKMASFFDNSSIALKLFTCLDLLDSKSLARHYGIEEYRYLLVYFFHDLEREEFFFVAHPLLYSQSMNSFRHYWSALGRLEDEVSELFGLKFYTNQRVQHDFIPKTRPYLLDRDFDLSDKNLVYLEENKTQKSEYDIQEFSLSDFGEFGEDVKFQMQTNGRVIKEFKVSLDSYFLMLEKKIESLKLSEVEMYISHFNTKTPFSYQLILKELVDYFEGTQKSFYQDAQMMLLNELSLIYDHLSSLSDSFKVFQELSVHKFLDEAKKKLYNILMKTNSFRPYPLITRSISSNFSSVWLREIVEFTQDYSDKMAQIKTSMMSQPEYLQHSSSSAFKIHPLKAGFTGLALKSFGVNYDLRKQRPYYLYNQIDLKVPLGISGSSYDRLLLRFVEVIESMSNIVRLIEGFPIYQNIEKTTPNYKYERQGQNLFLCLGQSGNGEIAMLLNYCHEENKILRFHVSTPTQRNLYSFEKFYKNTDFEKMGLDWVTLGMSMSEVRK